MTKRHPMDPYLYINLWENTAGNCAMLIDYTWGYYQNPKSFSTPFPQEPQQ